LWDRRVAEVPPTKGAGQKVIFDVKSSKLLTEVLEARGQ
jgi:hypothetical protein